MGLGNKVLVLYDPGKKRSLNVAGDKKSKTTTVANYTEYFSEPLYLSCPWDFKFTKNWTSSCVLMHPPYR